MHYISLERLDPTLAADPKRPPARWSDAMDLAQLSNSSAVNALLGVLVVGGIVLVVVILFAIVDPGRGGSARL